MPWLGDDTLCIGCGEYGPEFERVCALCAHSGVCRRCTYECTELPFAEEGDRDQVTNLPLQLPCLVCVQCLATNKHATGATTSTGGFHASMLRAKFIYIDGCRLVEFLERASTPLETTASLPGGATGSACRSVRPLSLQTSLWLSSRSPRPVSNVAFSETDVCEYDDSRSSSSSSFARSVVE